MTARGQGPEGDVTPESHQRKVVITNAVVERLTAKLCGDTIAIISTLALERQMEYLDAMHDRTRRALEELAEREAS